MIDLDFKPFEMKNNVAAVGQYIYIKQAVGKVSVKANTSFGTREYILEEREQAIVPTGEEFTHLTIQNLSELANNIEILTGFGRFIPSGDNQKIQFKGNITIPTAVSFNGAQPIYQPEGTAFNVDVNNFPTRFEISNFPTPPEIQKVNVENFPTPPDIQKVEIVKEANSDFVKSSYQLLTSARKTLLNPDTKRKCVHIQATGGNFYLGSSHVGVGTGLLIKDGEIRTFYTSAALYGISDNYAQNGGYAVTVLIMEELDVY